LFTVARFAISFLLLSARGAQSIIQDFLESFTSKIKGNPAPEKSGVSLLICQKYQLKEVKRSPRLKMATRTIIITRAIFCFVFLDIMAKNTLHMRITIFILQGIQVFFHRR
jgi:hypothetical protein